MNNNESKISELLKEWITLKTLTLTYLTVVLAPCVGIAVGTQSLSNDLKAEGYVLENDNKDPHITKEPLKMLIPGKTFMVMIEILSDAGKFHNDMGYRNVAIKNGLEKGLIKKITFNKHQ